MLPEHGPHRDAQYHQAGHEKDDIEYMKHVFNEIDAAAVRVTSFVQLLVGATVLMMVEMAATAAAGRRNHRRGLRLLFLLGHTGPLLGNFILVCTREKGEKTSLQDLIYCTESQLVVVAAASRPVFPRKNTDDKFQN